MTGGWSTPSRDRMEVGETFVQGKTQDNARDLLAAATDLGLSVQVVRTTNHGFIVPDEVWEHTVATRLADAGQDF